VENQLQTQAQQQESFFEAAQLGEEAIFGNVNLLEAHTKCWSMI
jgi:hypothetical protein